MSGPICSFCGEEIGPGSTAHIGSSLACNGCVILHVTGNLSEADGGEEMESLTNTEKAEIKKAILSRMEMAMKAENDGITTAENLAVLCDTLQQGAAKIGIFIKTPEWSPLEDKE